MTRKYQLTMDERQAQILWTALEFWMRVGGLGQFREVLDAWRMRCHRADNIDPAEVALDKAKFLLTSLQSGASHGIHSPDVPDEYRVAYDLEQVIRHPPARRQRQPGDLAACCMSRPEDVLAAAFVIGEARMERLLSDRQMARVLGVSLQTFARAVVEDPDLALLATLVLCPEGREPIRRWRLLEVLAHWQKSGTQTRRRRADALRSVSE